MNHWELHLGRVTVHVLPLFGLTVEKRRKAVPTITELRCDKCDLPASDCEACVMRVGYHIEDA
jgi:hypothetical protein